MDTLQAIGLIGILAWVMFSLTDLIEFLIKNHKC